jgi:hypothetical protein
MALTFTMSISQNDADAGRRHAPEVGEIRQFARAEAKEHAL